MNANSSLAIGVVAVLGCVSSARAETWNWNGHLVIPFGGVNVYYIENDQKRYINSMDTVACLGGYDQVIGVEPGVLAAWPEGPRKSDCAQLPAVRVLSSPAEIVYSTSDRASSTTPDVLRKSIRIPPGYSYLGVWYRETTANPRPADGLWSVTHGRNGDEVWVETLARANWNGTTRIWIGAEFRVQYTAASGMGAEAPSRQSTPPRQRAESGGTDATFFNGSGYDLHIFMASAPHGTVIDCDARAMYMGSLARDRTWAVKVPAGQASLIRFQLRRDNGCEERYNKFTSTVVGLAESNSERINIQ